jgi:excisionase family DNA binding protein
MRNIIPIEVVNVRFLSPEDIAEVLNVEVSTIRKWIREGSLKGIKFGGLWRVSEQDFEGFISKSKEQTETRTK